MSNFISRRAKKPLQISSRLPLDARRFFHPSKQSAISVRLLGSLLTHPPISVPSSLIPPLISSSSPCCLLSDYAGGSLVLFPPFPSLCLTVRMCFTPLILAPRGVISALRPWIPSSPTELFSVLLCLPLIFPASLFREIFFLRDFFFFLRSRRRLFACLPSDLTGFPVPPMFPLACTLHFQDLYPFFPSGFFQLFLTSRLRCF